MRAHVIDLLGDEAKRRAFGTAGREQVVSRSWKSVCSQLVGHYSRAIENPAPQVCGRGFSSMAHTFAGSGFEGTLRS